MDRLKLGIDDLLKHYEARVVEGLDNDDEYEDEALLALVARDETEDRLGQLTDIQRESLKHLDEVLASKHERVADVLPTKFSGDPGRWWWNLHREIP